MFKEEAAKPICLNMNNSLTLHLIYIATKVIFYKYRIFWWLEYWCKSFLIVNCNWQFTSVRLIVNYQYRVDGIQSLLGTIHVQSGALQLT